MKMRKSVHITFLFEFLLFSGVFALQPTGNVVVYNVGDIGTILANESSLILNDTDFSVYKNPEYLNLSVKNEISPGIFNITAKVSFMISYTNSSSTDVLLLTYDYPGNNSGMIRATSVSDNSTYATCGISNDDGNIVEIVCSDWNTTQGNEIFAVDVNLEWNVTISNLATYQLSQPILDLSNNATIDYVQNFTVYAPFPQNISLNVTLPDENVTLTGVSGNSTQPTRFGMYIWFTSYNIDTTGSSPKIGLKAPQIVYLVINQQRTQNQAVTGENVTWTTVYTVEYNNTYFQNLLAENLLFIHSLLPDSDISADNVTITGVTGTKQIPLAGFNGGYVNVSYTQFGYSNSSQIQIIEWTPAPTVSPPTYSQGSAQVGQPVWWNESVTVSNPAQEVYYNVMVIIPIYQDANASSLGLVSGANVVDYGKTGQTTLSFNISSLSAGASNIKYVFNFTTPAPILTYKTGWTQNISAESTINTQYIYATINITNPSKVVNYTNVIWSISCKSNYNCNLSNGTVNLTADSSQFINISASGDVVITLWNSSWIPSTGTYYQNITINETDTEIAFVNLTVWSSNFDDSKITAGEEFFGYWNGTAFIKYKLSTVGITLKSDCNGVNPTYSNISTPNGTFYICFQDTNGNGRGDYFKIKIPSTSSWVLQVGGNDATPPSVLLSLSSNSIVFGDYVTINWNVSDNGEIDTVKITVNNTLLYTGSQSNGSYVWTPSAVGTYQIKLEANDTVGNNNYMTKILTVSRMLTSISRIIEQKITTEITNTNLSAVINFINPNEPVVIEFEKSKNMNIFELNVTANTKVSSVKITIIKLKKVPVAEVAGKPYGYFSIEKENLKDDEITEAKLKFLVDKSWIINNNIDPNSIKLYRWSNGVWLGLKTEKIGEDSENLYFESITPGFSYFAISGKEKIAGPVCGNGICEEGEGYLTCPQDCECVENWVCTEWSECKEGKQIRTCTDKNNCGTTLHKPSEVKECEIPEVAVSSEEKPVSKPSYKTLYMLLVLAIVLLAGILLNYKRASKRVKKKSKK